MALYFCLSDTPSLQHLHPPPRFLDHVGIRCDNVLISGHYAGQWVLWWSQWSIHGLNWESHWSDSSFTSFTHKIAWNLTRISSLCCIFISLSLHAYFFSFLSFIDVFSLSTLIYLFISFFCSSGSGALPDVFDKTQKGNWLMQRWHEVCACTHTCQNNIYLQCHIFFFGLINYQSQHSFLACTFPSSLLSFGVLDPL